MILQTLRSTASAKVTLPKTHQLMNFEIMATGHYVPDLVVTNEDLARLGCDSDWIIQRTGIRERRHVATHEATSDLCARAAECCLEAAPPPRA
jgi:3-oxoacyl-[acyl-carrier-protein] synthase III